MKKTPPKRTKGIKPISDKKKEEMAGEIEIRRQLCKRAGGLFVTDGVKSRCIGGRCEICGWPPDWRGLHPHEEPFKSHGGKVSLKDSKMVCGECSSKKHGIKEVKSEPQWSKNGNKKITTKG